MLLAKGSHRSGRPPLAEVFTEALLDPLRNGTIARLSMQVR